MRNVLFACLCLAPAATVSAQHAGTVSHATRQMFLGAAVGAAVGAFIGSRL